MNNTMKSDNKEEKTSSLKNKILTYILWMLLFIVMLLIVCVSFKKFTYKLHSDINLELGSNTIELKNFYQNGKIPKNASLVTDVTKIDLNKVSDIAIKIKEKDKIKITNLHIIDTTSPKVEFQDLIKNIDYSINPNDFIIKKEDYSNMKVTLDKDIEINDYKNYMVKIIVSDEYGNKTIKDCNLIISIIKTDFHLEYGKKLTKEDILYDNAYAEYIKQEDIDKINNSNVGQYQIKAVINGIEFICNVNVTDTQAPNLKLQNITIYNTDELPDLKKFIVSVSDASKYTLNFKSELEKNKMGKQTVIIEAVDKYNNKVKKQATLNVIKDKVPPKISGTNTLTIDKNTEIDFNKGVSAYDSKDGEINYTVDSSNVNNQAYGTYYAIYTASDKSGNKSIVNRKIIVNHDANDTKEKLINLASDCQKDYEGLRGCVSKKISYNSSWGGTDPIWEGLTKFKGNCYVHALIYQELLQIYGYETKLIWVTDKTHYWNLIKINGVWRHSDSTPTSLHSMIISATDEERYLHLQGRNWDRTLWPEAN